MKYLDFDRMLRERAPERVRVRIFGRDLEIGDRIPAVLVLELMRYEEGEPVPAAALVRAAGWLFGDECVKGWVEEDQISLEELAEVVRGTLQMLNGGGEARAPVTEDEAEDRPKN